MWYYTITQNLGPNRPTRYPPVEEGGPPGDIITTAVTPIRVFINQGGRNYHVVLYGQYNAAGTQITVGQVDIINEGESVVGPGGLRPAQARRVTLTRPVTLSVTDNDVKFPGDDNRPGYTEWEFDERGQQRPMHFRNGDQLSQALTESMNYLANNPDYAARTTTALTFNGAFVAAGQLVTHPGGFNYGNIQDQPADAAFFNPLEQLATPQGTSNLITPYLRVSATTSNTSTVTGVDLSGSEATQTRIGYVRLVGRYEHDSFIVTHIAVEQPNATTGFMNTQYIRLTDDAGRPAEFSFSDIDGPTTRRNIPFTIGRLNDNAGLRGAIIRALNTPQGGRPVQLSMATDVSGGNAALGEFSSPARVLPALAGPGGLTQA